jgi:hypothetical protein
MDRTTLAFFCTLLAALTLSSCASMTPPGQRHAGACNTLRSDLVFNGSTSNVREAEIQSSQQPLEQHTYDKDNCDQG